MLKFSYLTGSSSRHSPSDFPGSGGVAPPPNTKPNAPRAPSEESPSTPPINRPNTLRSINNLRAGAIQHAGTVRAGHSAQLERATRNFLHPYVCEKELRTYRLGSPRLVSGLFRFERECSDSCFSYSASSSSVYEYSSREANIEVVRLASRFFLRSPPNSYRTWRSGASMAFTSTSRSLTFSRKSCR